jgi:hypothetical protein
VARCASKLMDLFKMSCNRLIVESLHRVLLGLIKYDSKNNDSLGETNIYPLIWTLYFLPGSDDAIVDLHSRLVELDEHTEVIKYSKNIVTEVLSKQRGSEIKFFLSGKRNLSKYLLFMEDIEQQQKK